MRYILVIFVLILLSSNVSHAFEIDGLKSGMSMEAERSLLETYSYRQIQIKENSILASDQSGSDGRFIALTFCEGKLVGRKNI